MNREEFDDAVTEVEFEFAKLQETVARKRLKVAIVFEGRDAAGKGGVIKTILKRMNPRIWRVVALPKPSDRELTEWYFQRYVRQLPAGGEVVLFDRSWYNRAVVEPVMGFCTQDQYEAFMREVPQFEKMLVDSGTILIKYWIHVSADEQEDRFQDRACDPRKRWKLSPIDLEGRRRWVEFAKYRDAMFMQTHTDHAPWRTVDGDDKEKARLNCMRSILDTIPYEFNEEAFEPIKLPARQTAKEVGYDDPEIGEDLMVKDYYPGV
ncbi:MAG: polyphosphate kinase 2 [Parvularculaceae bacterium]|nr:polyphosphate kinase 2 [Parvularculaceae bacterium]